MRGPAKEYITTASFQEENCYLAGHQHCRRHRNPLGLGLFKGVMIKVPTVLWKAGNLSEDLVADRAPDSPKGVGFKSSLLRI